MEAQNQNYLKAKELRARIEQQAKGLLPCLEALKSDMADFYELMRWTNLGCSTDEYSQLYDGFVYSYEESGVDTSLRTVIQFLNTDTRSSLEG